MAGQLTPVTKMAQLEEHFDAIEEILNECGSDERAFIQDRCETLSGVVEDLEHERRAKHGA